MIERGATERRIEGLRGSGVYGYNNARLVHWLFQLGKVWRVWSGTGRRRRKETKGKAAGGIAWE